MTVIGPSEFWGAWVFDPGTIVLLGAAALAYGLGVARLWSAGPGRGLTHRRVASFYLGLFVLVVALMSPVDALSASLFSAHMSQHLLLVLVVAPLLVFGESFEAVVMSLPLATRRSIGRLKRAPMFSTARRILMNPLVAVALATGALWAWHVPRFYELALRADAVHALEHASFLGTSMLVWSLVIGAPRRRRLDHATGIAVLVALLLESTVLAAVLVFAGTVLYPSNTTGAALWGLTPAEDQGLAGVIMWAPMGTIYIITIAVLFLRWMRSMDARFPSETIEVADV